MSDREGVWVPPWAMERCGGDPRDAMVYCQITWWLQPSQEDGSPRTSKLVERDGHRWMYLTDAELGADVGMSAAQVFRARGSLKKLGLIDTQSRRVNGRKVTLVRVIAQSREVAESDPNIAISRNGNRESAECDFATSRNTPSIETREKPEETAEAVASAARPDVEELCAYLAERIRDHRGGEGKPNITARWREDMRLLVDRGELHADDAEPRPPDRVRACVDVVFGELATPEGSGGFCWADQIRSPGALRDHWHQLRSAARSRRNGSRSGPATKTERGYSVIREMLAGASS